MANFHIFHGLPGSGKSTLAQKLAESIPGSIIVNRDSIRTELFGESYHRGKFPKASEAKVSEISRERILTALLEGRDAINDDTNLNRRFLSGLLDLAERGGAEIVQHHVDVPVKVAKERNKARAAAGGRDVPEFVIDRMAKGAYDDAGRLKRFVISDSWCGAISESRPGKAIVESFNAELAEARPLAERVVAIDIDGTLANNAADLNRMMFGGPRRNYRRFYESIIDAPVNQAVVEAANLMRSAGLSLVVVTGRSDEAASQLVSFVQRSGLEVSKIFVKPEGDFRKDFDYKDSVVRELEGAGHKVVHSIDDREQSVNFYLRRGISVSRVDEHQPVDPREAPEFYDEPRLNTLLLSGYCFICETDLDSEALAHEHCLG